MMINKQIDYVYNKNVSSDITIIHISDIHFNKKTKVSKLVRIYEKIVKDKPNYVVITGDLIDRPDITKDKYKMKELLDFLTNMANNSIVLIAIGNHDIVSDSDYKFYNNLNDLKNIYVLNNDVYKDNKILFGGINLPVNYYYNVTRKEDISVFLETLNNNRKLIDKLPSNIPKVLLVHSPIRVLDKEILDEIYSYDLILSGHTHGGMIPDRVAKLLKGNYGIISPSKKLLPSLARGRKDIFYKNRDISLIISSGITKLSEVSGKILCNLNFMYSSSINKIVITNSKTKRVTKKIRDLVL